MRLHGAIKARTKLNISNRFNMGGGGAEVWAKVELFRMGE